MRYALLAIASLALTAPAFAQQNLEQPKEQDDGVGVDYSQPYMNDLLLRMEPPRTGNLIGRVTIPSCLTQFNAAKEDPTDPDLRAALEACAVQQKQALRDLAEMRKAQPAPGPGPRFPLYKPEPGDPPLGRRLPLTPDHPNAQD